MLYEGNGEQGKYGKRGKLLLHCSSTDIPVGEGWSIARRCITIAMDQGGSIKIGSQIFPEFVQAQTVFFNHDSILR
jgi:hypothetical protein